MSCNVQGPVDPPAAAASDLESPKPPEAPNSLTASSVPASTQGDRASGLPPPPPPPPINNSAPPSQSSIDNPTHPQQPLRTICLATTTTLVSHRYSQDGIIPSLGQLIKIKLANPLNGPGSRISSSAPSRATPQNYHSAIVTAVLVTQMGGILVSVLPVPSYSGAQDSTRWVSQLPLDDFRKHIPMPCPSSSPTTPTPQEFGTPINPRTTLNGQSTSYIDRRPSWILLEQQTFLLSFNTSWKSFSPDVYFPITELNRLQAYMVQLQGATIQVNMVTVPDVITDTLRQLFGAAMGSGSGIDELLRGGVYELEDDRDEDSEGDCESECDPIEYYQMLPNKSPWMQRVIEEGERSNKVSQEKRILEWMDEAEDSGTGAL